MNSENFPRLYQFLGAYFHEDWMCESEDADDIVRSFMADASLESILRVVGEVYTLVNQEVTESELRDFLLRDMGCCYCYWDDWPSGASWLTHILVLLRGKA